MKKTKFAVLFTALVTMLGLSSCLGDPDPYATDANFFKVASIFPVSFKDALGIKLIPTNQNIFTTTNVDLNGLALVQYRYDSRNVSQTTKEVDAEVLAFVPVKKIESNQTIDVENNSPMKEVDRNYTFFDTKTLIVAVSYNYKKSSDQNAMVAELNKHRFYVVEEEPKDGETVNEKVLNLQLVHSVPDPEANKDRKDEGNEYRYIDLNGVLNGRVPEIIRISYKVKSYSDENKLEDVNMPLEIKYKEFVDRVEGK